jgi:hypothetical protein
MRDILKPNGKEFSLLNLHNNTHKVQTISAQRKVLIRSIADIRVLQDGDIEVPIIGNFPFIDLVIKPGILIINSTILLCHSGTLSAIRSALGGTKAQQLMLFVVPSKNVAEFSPTPDLK